MYVHDLDPVLLPIWGPLAIRWYGLAYVAGFVVAFLILNRWGKRGDYPLHGEALQNFMITIVLGVMLGGRLGYMLFYDFESFARNPLVFFKLWEGGMASHGGMIGITIAAWIFTRQKKVSFLSLTDGLVATGTIGLGFGRIANFINGELWGRPTEVSWAVIFPESAGISRLDPDFHALVAAAVEQGFLVPRHPSQLYQAALEGILLPLILIPVYKSAWRRGGVGRVSGLYLGLYAIVRFVSEFFREPEIVHFGWMTQGQMLSLVILLPASAYFIGRTYRQPERLS